MGKEIFEISNRLLVRNLLKKIYRPRNKQLLIIFTSSNIFSQSISQISMLAQRDLSKKFLRFEEANVPSLPLISSSKSRLIRNPIYRSNYTQVLVLEISLVIFPRSDANEKERMKGAGREE